MIVAVVGPLTSASACWLHRRLNSRPHDLSSTELSTNLVGSFVAWLRHSSGPDRCLNPRAYRNGSGDFFLEYAEELW